MGWRPAGALQREGPGVGVPLVHFKERVQGLASRWCKRGSRGWRARGVMLIVPSALADGGNKSCDRNFLGEVVNPFRDPVIQISVPGQFALELLQRLLQVGRLLS